MEGADSDEGQAGGQRVAAGESPLRSGSLDEEEAEDEDITPSWPLGAPSRSGVLFDVIALAVALAGLGVWACHDAIARCLDALVEGLSFMEAVLEPAAC